MNKINKTFLFTLLAFLLSCGSESDVTPDGSDDMTDDVEQEEPEEEEEQSKLIITLSVDEDYIRDDVSAYYVIKGDDGETLEFATYENGDEIEVNLPYEGEEIALTTITVPGATSIDFIRINSYIDIPVGQAFTLNNDLAIADAEATFQGTNADPDWDEIILGNKNLASIGRAQSLNFETGFPFKFPSDSPFNTITTYQEGGIPFFQTFEFVNGEINQIDFANSISMDNHIVNTSDGSLNYEVEVRGLDEDKNGYLLYRNEYLSFLNGELFLYYPGAEFESYDLEIALTQENTIFTQHTTGSLPSEFVKLDATLTATGTDLESMAVQTEGSVSYLKTLWRSNISNTEALWTVYSENELNNSYNLADLPESILAESDSFSQLDEMELIYMNAVAVGSESYETLIDDLIDVVTDLNEDVRNKPNVSGKRVYQREQDVPESRSDLPESDLVRYHQILK